ncbi:lysylphosphatidylglycerol synthase transmembrane domain-containing protein [Thermodesulfatator autotrophicus]|uniref:TIGR00374 family protein n=1 Tax=Thermodesulfatator autotrophicus TaxID=1795632 RepID=A0A177E5T9_9BACT|nr:lysylphosphatidylglycerol synthase transmembrane domain-containing protein [Thermodesulfatator autotrophicus]OAG26851.1 hypothetical protein TH606_10100 [Thermodesulfatator autotrophicus]
MRSKYFRLFLSIILGIICFVLLLFKINLSQTWEILKQANWRFLVLCAALNIGVIYLKAERWRLIVSTFIPLERLPSFCLTTLAFWGNTILPMRAGDFGRGFYLIKRKLNWGTGLSTVAVDRFMDSLGLISLVLPFYFNDTLPLFLKKGLFWLTVVMCISLIIIWNPLKQIKTETLATTHPLLSWLSAITEGFKSLTEPKVLIATYFLSIASWLTQIYILVFTAKALNVYLSFSEATIVLLGLNLALLLPNPPANLGLFHAAIVLVMGFLNFSENQAMAVAVVYHAIQTLTVAVLGLTFNILESKILD